MIILDDILLFPARSMLWFFREISNAAKDELANEAEAITARLSELYMMLETEKITEAEFDAEEKVLLERLDQIQNRETHIKDEDDQD